MFNLSQAVDHMQTLDMAAVTAGDFMDSAFQLGLEDGLDSEDRRGSVYFLIAGAAYNAYDAGYDEGVAMRQRLTGVVLATVRSELQCMDDALETICQQPAASPAWYAVVEDERVGAEYSASPWMW